MLQAQSLGVRRGSRAVFRDMNFTLHAGNALLIKGQNGSGKSSLLRAVAGLLPMSGAILWDERTLQSARADHDLRTHYVGHLDALKPELSADEMIDYWGALFDQPTSAFRDLFAIADFRCRPIRHLSAGQKRRIGLSRLGLYSAPLWLLDEPTTALDATTHALLMDHIAQHRATGGIVLIATHYDLDLSDAQTLIMGGARP